MAYDPTPHDWRPTGLARRHLEPSPMFKYGTPVVTYYRCTRCDQVGYRRPNSRIVYTWQSTIHEK